MALFLGVVCHVEARDIWGKDISCLENVNNAVVFRHGDKHDFLNALQSKIERKDENIFQ